MLHLDSEKNPSASWNDAKYYYPGDDYIDWVGLSVFGRQLPQNQWLLFPAQLKKFMPEVEEMTKTRPLMISEFAVIEDASDPLRKAEWLKQAMQSISRGLFPRVKAVTYWNSPGWLTNGKANFKIDSSPEALQAFQDEIMQPFWISNGAIRGL